MLAGFHIFHKKNPTGTEWVPNCAQATFKTCLRSIHFAWLDESTELVRQNQYEVYKDVRAYQFILEVICGLHSPVVGETEVFGQFRDFWQSLNVEYPLRQIFSNLISDAKKIRGQHLVQLGGQSYGSLLRKEIGPFTRVTFIGGGKFVEDLLPWLYKDENQITLSVRDPQKVLQTHGKKFPKIKIQSLEESVCDEVVIVAAPLSAKEIECKVLKPESLVLDLRGESRQDRCQKFKNYKDLSAFFELIQSNQQQISQAKAQALKAIDQISLKRYMIESLRPFGWDDICVW